MAKLVRRCRPPRSNALEVLRATFTVAPWAVFAAIGCSEGPESGVPPPASAGTLHPDQTALLSSRSPVPLVEVSMSDGAAGSSGMATMLLKFDDEAAVGELDGAPEIVFGSLIDGAVLATGDVVLLDTDYGALRVFSDSLEPRSIVGTFGDGPGEFLDPTAVFAMGDAVVGVVDRAGRRIERFSFESSGAGPSGRVPLGVQNSYDACYRGGRLIATGLLPTALAHTARDSPELVHEVDLAGGELVRSYSSPYDHLSDPLVVDIFGIGLVDCEDEPDGGIWVAYPFLGEVHAFDGEAGLRWITRLTDMKLRRYVRTEHSIGIHLGDATTVERIVSSSLIAPSVLAVQVESRTRGQGETSGWETSHRVYLLNTETGGLVDAFEIKHRILAAGQGRVVLYRDRPFPRISLVRLGHGDTT